MLIMPRTSRPRAPHRIQTPDGDGRVEGTIDPKGHRLTIGPNGRVKANITACAVVVQGKLDGNIQASDRVELKQSASVVGDIVTRRISIEC